MKRLAAAAICSLLSGAVHSADCAVKAPAALVSAGKLTIVTHLTSPPQAFEDNGKPAGFAVQLGEALARQTCCRRSSSTSPSPFSSRESTLASSTL